MSKRVNMINISSYLYFYLVSLNKSNVKLQNYQIKLILTKFGSISFWWFFWLLFIYFLRFSGAQI